MTRIIAEVEFEEGDQVYFKVDQEKEWMIVGHVLSDGVVRYICSTPELGPVEASAKELITERNMF